MKPAPFAYDAPNDTEQALELLATHGDEAKVLAGGQSLIPLLNFRLARPTCLVDISRISALSYIEPRGTSLLIGATTSQATLEGSALVAHGWPLLIEAVRQVAHPQIRTLGTVGGSVAHADPAAELPAAFTTLDAQFHVRSAYGTRTVAAREFFAGYFTTVLEPEELMVAIEVPAMPAGTGHAFVEFARRAGDFALGGAAALVTLDARGLCSSVSLTLLGAESPWRSPGVQETLVGGPPNEQTLGVAARAAIQGFTPTGDIHGGTRYRTGLAQVMALRALRLATARARNGGTKADRPRT